MQRSLRLLALLVITLMPAAIVLNAGPAGGGVALPSPLEIIWADTDFSEGLLSTDITFGGPVPPEVTEGVQAFPVTVLVELHFNADYYLVGQVNVFADGAFLPIGFCVDCPPGAGLDEFSVTTELCENRECLSSVMGPFPGLDMDVSDMSVRVVTLVNSPAGAAVASFPGGNETVAIGEEQDLSGAPELAEDEQQEQDTAAPESGTEGDVTGTNGVTDLTEGSSTPGAADEAEPATGDTEATGTPESDGGVGGVVIGIVAGALLLAAVAVVSVLRGRFATKERDNVAGDDEEGGEDAGSGNQDVTPGTAPATRPRGKCHEERLESDEAQTAWEATVKAKGEAETAYTDAMTSGDQAAISAAHSARQEAYDAETDAYTAYQLVWNVYQDCLAGELDSAHAPPPATETRPREPVTEPEPTTATPASAAPTVASTNKFEWRVEKNKHASWRVPVGHVRITMGRTTEEFEDWLAEHGTIEEQTRSILAWLSLPLFLIDAAVGTEVEATLSLDDVDDLRDASSSQPMLVEGRLKHWVNMEIVIPTHTVGRYCERKWIREDGPWRPTDETRLGEPDDPIESDRLYVRDDYETARSLAEALAWMLKQAQNLEFEAAQAQIDLRERCAGG